MIKGSLQWFEKIVNLIGEDLVGIEMTHYPPEVAVSPHVQVQFVLKEFYFDKLPEYIKQLEEIEGFRSLYPIWRGKEGQPGDNMKHMVAFDFYEGGVPHGNMLKMAKKLGFTIAPEFCNNQDFSGRFSPKIF